MVTVYVQIVLFKSEGHLENVREPQGRALSGQSERAHGFLSRSFFGSYGRSPKGRVANVACGPWEGGRRPCPPPTPGSSACPAPFSRTLSASRRVTHAGHC